METAIELRDLLCRMLGMPESVAHTYLELLRSSAPLEPATETEHRNLRHLEDCGFVIADPGGDGIRRYYPLDPSIVATSIHHMFEWNFPPGHEEYGVDEVDRLCELISETNGGIGPREAPSSFTYLEGAASISNFLARLIPHATQLLCVSAAAWATNLPLIWAALRKRLEEGLDYRRIASLDSFVAFGYEINKRDLWDLHINLRLVEAQSLKPVVYVIQTSDSKGVLLFNDVQMRLTGRQEATFLTHPTLVMRLTEAAEASWRSAVDGGQLLERMPDIRESFLSKVANRLGSDYSQAAQTVFDHGVFAEPSLTEPGKLATLVEHGFLVESSLRTLGISAYQANILDEMRQVLAQLKEGPNNEG